MLTLNTVLCEKKERAIDAVPEFEKVIHKMDQQVMNAYAGSFYICFLKALSGSGGMEYTMPGFTATAVLINPFPEYPTRETESRINNEPRPQHMVRLIG